MDAKGHKWSNLEHDTPALCDAAFQLHRCMNQYMKKKSKNKWKEGGYTWVDRLSGDWEEMGAPLCLVCVCMSVLTLCVHLWWCLRPILHYCPVFVYWDSVCVFHVAYLMDMLVSCLVSTQFDSSTGSIFQDIIETLCCKWVLKSINKKTVWLNSMANVRKCGQFVIVCTICL